MPVGCIGVRAGQPYHLLRTSLMRTVGECRSAGEGLPACVSGAARYSKVVRQSFICDATPENVTIGVTFCNALTCANAKRDICVSHYVFAVQIFVLVETFFVFT